jgi:hypothetical protein
MHVYTKRNPMHVLMLCIYTQKMEIFHITCMMMYGLWRVKKYRSFHVDLVSRKMQCYVCVTCGVQYPPSKCPPSHCIISEDEREFLNKDGQLWTTREEMLGKYRNIIKEEETNLFSIQTEPHFGIGQRACLIRTSHGNILWDWITYFDQETIN